MRKPEAERTSLTEERTAEQVRAMVGVRTPGDAELELASSATTLPLSGEQMAALPSRPLLDFVFPRESRVPLVPGRHALGRDEPWPWGLASSAVSRRHAELEVSAGVVSISDLGSRNGVHVNGQRCDHARLSPGDVVRLGDHVGVVRELAESEHAAFTELLPELWGRETLRRAAAVASTAAPSLNPVLVLGETGTGKEIVARAIHARSGRAGACVPVNCAALSANLLEAELFGHAKGAFTGAETKRVGLIRSADSGTLFLDEVGELPLTAQAKLLRVLQSGEVLPVGVETPLMVEVRFIAATHRDLEELVARGAFREDLYHRLAGIRVRLPALRERKEDIVPLFAKFVRAKLPQAPEFAPSLIEALCLYQWPGNVRQLRQVAEAMTVMCAKLPRWRREQLPSELRAAIDGFEDGSFPSAPARPRELDAQAICGALRRNAGNVSQAARELGVARQSLYALIRRFEIDADSFRTDKA